MPSIELDPASLREWLAAVGLLRLVSETTESGRLYWRREFGRYRLVIDQVPSDLASRCVEWVKAHRKAWAFAGKGNVDFDGEFWRAHAGRSEGVEAALWCAVASDGILHRSGEKLQASSLEYARGGGHQHWLASLRAFMERNATEAEFSRLLAGEPSERMPGDICRWDPACERSHAYRAIAPTKDPMIQDQIVNTLAAIGFASCPAAPTRRGLVTPLAFQRGVLQWPVWRDPLRLPDLEAALCCGWPWPTMVSRRWLSGKLYCFSRGQLREP